MSGWHREHPELAGTDADPWMRNAGHRAAAREAALLTRFPNLDAMIAEAEARSSHVCTDPDCREVQGAGDRCECGAPLTEREP